MLVFVEGWSERSVCFKFFESTKRLALPQCAVKRTHFLAKSIL